MSGKLASIIFLSACIVIAALILTRIVTPNEGGVAFAIALVALGVLSDGFKRKPKKGR
ncbi:MAG: hypothetical protein AB1775_11815 [Bacteroidota bacterium]